MDKYLDWAALQNDIIVLRDRINAKNIKPDYIVGCSPDGLVVAQMMGDLMNVENIRILSFGKDMKVAGDFNDNLNGKNVLLLFPLVNNKELVDASKACLKKKGAKIAVAGLYTMKGLQCDFSICDVKSVVFPWKNF